MRVAEDKIMVVLIMVSETGVIHAHVRPLTWRTFLFGRHDFVAVDAQLVCGNPGVSEVLSGSQIVFIGPEHRFGILVTLQREAGRHFVRTTWS